MILTHFASRRAVVDFGEGETRLDAEILLTVGRAPIVLRAPRADFDFAFPSHELPSGEVIACHKAGVVETPTLLILGFLANEDVALANDLVARAVGDDSAALLSRFDIALRMLADSGKTERAKWAKTVHAQTVEPALARHIGKH